ncbi:MAG: hypothetical protein IPK82_33920 [Polyangiaceae bacterium]|nr:hypothetical protein [Polyangiaceae bacterium]
MRPERPGLAKTRGHRLFVRRAVELWASVPGAVAELVRGADVVSEGATRTEVDGRAYYGSTHLLFRPSAQFAASPSELCARLAQDPHFRLHVLRVAVREASHRAGAPIGSVSAEIAFREVPSGALVTIDLSASVETADVQTG